MSKEIIRGYWDCSFCNTKGIDGLIDICPNCGAGKKKDVKYYMKSTDDVVSEQELNDAGISIEECDGNHKEWICPYCGNVNNYTDETCQYCNGDKKEKEYEYGDYNEEQTKKKIEKEQLKKSEAHYETSSIEQKSFHIQNKSKRSFKPVIVSLLSILMVIALVIGFYPIKENWIVNGFSWNRCITVEQQRTVDESGWTLPSGARLQYTKNEIKSYADVIDHYETVNETKTRQVIDHYETSYYYRDNGNGTFSKESSQSPVYRTETYIETKQKPVYRKEPIYATKYYYEIDRWFDLKDFKSSGTDKNPYWNTDYILNDLERDTKRMESYYILYNNGETTKESYDKWKKTKLNDVYQIIKCRFGFIYKTKNISK